MMKDLLVYLQMNNKTKAPRIKKVTIETIMSTKGDKNCKENHSSSTSWSTNIHKETNRVEPRETLRKITVTVQEPPKPALNQHYEDKPHLDLTNRVRRQQN
jgi:hypothetical protein